MTGRPVPADVIAASSLSLLVRRLLSVCYDWVLVIALILVAGLPLPLIPEHVRMSLTGRVVILMAMVLISFLYFALSWKKTGQTVGMRAWRLRLWTTDDSGQFSLTMALRRFLYSIPAWGLCLAGVLLILVDSKQRAWHDRLSNSRVSLIRKKTRQITGEKV